MLEELAEYVTCRKCGCRLTPQESGFYGTSSPPRCNKCRTVNRNYKKARTEEVVTAVRNIIGPTPENERWLNMDGLTRTAMNDIKGVSWVAHFLLAGYAVRNMDWSVYDGIANYTNERGKIVRQRVARSARILVLAELMETFLVDQDFEVFNNEMTARTKNDGKVWKVIHGEEIRDAYHSTGYAANTGTLRYSCMSGKEAQKYLDIYVKNPDKVGLLVLYNAQNELVGRALVWKTLQDNTYMDRVYGTDIIQSAFRAHADREGWTTSRAGVSVQLDEWGFKYYPSVDSMFSLNPLTGIASADTSNTKDVSVILHSVSGSYTVTSVTGRHINPARDDKYNQPLIKIKGYKPFVMAQGYIEKEDTKNEAVSKITTASVPA